jgi:DNA polymerase-1
MILQVHDELVLEVPEGELAEVAALTVQVMENVYTLKAPLRATAQVGLNWRDMETLNMT